MNHTVDKLLSGDMPSHLFPFFWQHGEDEATLRKYVGIMQQAHCGGFCIESRPHPDFCGSGWWRDLRIILGEAKRRGMRVWILDDSHFPTGYANGALKKADPSLCKQSIVYRELCYRGGKKAIRFPLARLSHPPKYKTPRFSRMMTLLAGRQRHFRDDHVLGLTAYGPDGEVIDLTGKSGWIKPAGTWRVAALALSRNCGARRNYINLLSHDSCRALIDAVYEPHYANLKEYFGDTLAGFFSDEPELGNFAPYAENNFLGTQQDLPWSAELAAALEQTLGTDWKSKLPLLWKNDFDADETAGVRLAYMDAVTKLARRDFFYQMRDWCHAHKVEYIGHLLEDNSTHSCTGPGVGHFFRGIEAFDFAGYDIISDQIHPGTEDAPDSIFMGRKRSGGFYHYTLAKLGVSAAQLDPKKKGNTFCEIFGNYGWKLTIGEMKYLADFCMVRGTNYFVPHAFNPKKYPDYDCPPHFYADGNDPQFRHFCALCGYINRVCELISNGKIDVRVAILYNAESDWMQAKTSMPLDVPARMLYDNQIDFLFLPADDLGRAKEFDYVVVPRAGLVPKRVTALENAVFIDERPKDCFNGDVVALDELVPFLDVHGVRDVILTPRNNRIRCMHYRRGHDLYYFVNEGATLYQGAVKLPQKGGCYAYNAWENTIEPAERSEDGVTLILEPKKSLLLLFDEPDAVRLSSPPERTGVKMALAGWTRSLCRSVDYPCFTGRRDVMLPDRLAEEKPKFSGFARYETVFRAELGKRCLLVITDAAEGVEVFVNGASAGIQIAPEFVFNLTPLLQEGENALAVEVATTAERDAFHRTNPITRMIAGKPKTKSGITGSVYLLEQSGMET
ncbi:MAG TPA: hypothetical protein P5075_05370 [Eubacteriales bacterium]|nr:hypothetical protein [Eubacteriales bacterium]